jgi:serine protease Do
MGGVIMDYDNFNNNSWESGVKFVEERKSKRVLRFLSLLFIIFFSASIGGVLGGYYVKKSYGDSLYNNPNVQSYNSTSANNLETETETANIPKNSITKVAEMVGPTVVGINNNVRTWGGGEALQGSGSGIIFDKNGYIVTNEHVIEGATSVTVTLSGGRKVSAKIIGADAKTDLAVLKVDAKDLPVAKFGDSSKVRVGDTSIAIGNPLGEEFAGSVTVGVISALNRTMNVDGRTYKVIQTDAAINNGNSGGALLNEAGEVIGINSLKLGEAEGMGFAISINEAKPIIESLMKNGYVARPYLGIVYVFLDKDLAAEYDVPQGIGIREVASGSSADEAGIRPGDVMTSFDGVDLTKEGALQESLEKHKVGDSVSIKLWRDGKTLDLKLTIGDSKGNKF